MTTEKFVQFIVVALLVFSIWVAFALLVVNPYLHPYVPGYKVGRPCGWEFIALFASFGITHFWTRSWPVPMLSDRGGVKTISLNYSFVRFLLLYLATGVAIFLWKYAIFSGSFG